MFGNIMADKTKIEYLDTTWSPIKGCSKVSSGCKKCWAERVAARFSKPGENFSGLTTNGKWSGDIRLYPHELIKPLQWQRSRRIGVSLMGDLFHEDAYWQDQAAVFGAMLMAPQHQFLLLTKRPERISLFMGNLSHPSLRAWCEDQLINPRLSLAQLCVEIAKRKTAEHRFDHRRLEDLTFPPKNVWAGTSVEDQKHADKRISELVQAQGFNGRNWVSVEPLLDAVTLKEWLQYLDWVVVGGESGPGYRPMNLDWARALRDECAEAEVPFFFKQTAGKGEIPKDLDVRQMPLQFRTTKPKEKKARFHGTYQREGWA